MTGPSYGDKGTPEPILTDTVGDVEHEDYAIGAEHPAPPAVEERTYPSPGKAWYCVFVLALAVLVNFLDRNILNLLAESIKRDLQLTEIETSLILGVAFTVFYSIFGLPVARLVDRGNRKKIMAAGIAIWSVMTAFCGLASSFWQLFVGRVGCWRRRNHKWRPSRLLPSVRLFPAAETAQGHRRHEHGLCLGGSAWPRFSAVC